MAERNASQLLRMPPTVQQYAGRTLRIAGTDYINFSGNDYLGLASEPAVLQALANGASLYGAGSSGSPLVIGHHQIHQQLADELARWLGFERVLLFSSGFAANQAMLLSLAAKQDTLLLDKLCHASLIDAALYSSAHLTRFKHNDVNALAALLSQHDRAMVVTEGIFSMDGDGAPLRNIVPLCQQYKAALLLDDAHGLGVAGDAGRGSAAAAGVLPSELFCYMANFGKALGVSGAFLAGSKTVIDYIEQFGRHYVYSTALSPAICAAVMKSVDLCRTQQWRRDKLYENIAAFRHQAADLPLLDSQSAIQGVVLGSADRALAISEQLKQQQIWLTAIRPPTVPANSARLRITLSSQHQPDDITRLVTVLRKLL